MSNYDDASFDDSYDDYDFTLTDERDQTGESFGGEHLFLQHWFAANFSSQEALALQNAGLTVDEAIGFRNLGIDPTQAEILVAAGYGPDNLHLTDDGSWLVGERALPSLASDSNSDLDGLRDLVATLPVGPRRRSRAKNDGQLPLFASHLEDGGNTTP